MRFPFLTLALTSAIALIYFVAGPIPDNLIWQQPAQLNGWQWFTSHLAHLDIEHLVCNLAALLMLGTLVEQTSRKMLLAALAIGIVAVNLYLASLYTLAAYAGLSGALNALLVLALYFLHQKPGYELGCQLTLGLVVVKIVIEYVFNLSLFTQLPWPSVPQAHLAGLIGGILLCAFLEFRRKMLLQSDLINFEEAAPNAEALHRCSVTYNTRRAVSKIISSWFTDIRSKFRHRDTGCMY